MLLSDSQSDLNFFLNLINPTLDCVFSNHLVGNIYYILINRSFSIYFFVCQFYDKFERERENPTKIPKILLYVQKRKTKQNEDEKIP